MAVQVDTQEMVCLTLFQRQQKLFKECISFTLSAFFSSPSSSSTSLVCPPKKSNFLKKNNINGKYSLLNNRHFDFAKNFLKVSLSFSFITKGECLYYPSFCSSPQYSRSFSSSPIFASSFSSSSRSEKNFFSPNRNYSAYANSTLFSLKNKADKTQRSISTSRKMHSNGQAHPSLFSTVVEAPADPILGVEIAYKNDPFEKKVNLGIGSYRTEQGKPYVFRIVREVEKKLANDESLNKEYLPIDGLPELKPLTQKMVFGETSASVKENRICSIQSLSGTGALRVAAEFITSCLNTPKVVYLSAPTWANHQKIFTAAGFQLKEYPYWDNQKKCLNINGMLDTLSSAAPSSVVLLHGCAHNPTGMDPSEEEWRRIKECVTNKKLIVILDVAYQGYASGDLDRDAFSIRLFDEQSNDGNNDSVNEFFVCQSFAKNLGLYGERIGMLHTVCADEEKAKCVLSNMKVVARRMYSNPPLHGAHILREIFSDRNLYGRWVDELKEVSGRINKVRRELVQLLEKKQTPGKWTHITQQIGMFSYTGLTPAQCEMMIKKWHIYMLKNGRISLAGLNDSNLEYVVDAIDDCVRNAEDIKGKL